jgi:hypothetical protein
MGGDIPINSETFLVIDFMNLKIKSAQSFECAHKDNVCIHMFIGVNAHMSMIIYIYSVSKKSPETQADGLLGWARISIS